MFPRLNFTQSVHTEELQSGAQLILDSHDAGTHLRLPPAGEFRRLSAG
jgi:hypothetical protein